MTKNSLPMRKKMMIPVRMSEKLVEHMDGERFQRVSDIVCWTLLAVSFAAFIGVNLFFWLFK